MKSTTNQPSRAWRVFGVAVAVGWLGFFAYLLLAADPPDFFFDDIADVDGPAHFLGGATTGVIAYLLLARRRRPVGTALLVSIGLLLALELIQDRFTSRRWEASDVLLAVAGALVGVAVAAVGVGLRRRSTGD